MYIHYGIQLNKLEILCVKKSADKVYLTLLVCANKHYFDWAVGGV